MTTHERETIRALRATLAKMEIALGSIDDAIVWVDPRGVVTWCNAAFDGLAGRAHIDLIGAPIERVLPLAEEGGQPVPPAEHPVRALLQRPQRQVGVYHLSRPKGVSVVQVEGTGLPPPEGGAVVVVRDITLLRQAERDRMRLMQEELARRDAEERARARDLFMMIASHELRTPLTALSLSVRVLDQLAVGPERSHIPVLQGQVRRLKELVDTILDVSSIAVGRLELTPKRVDLADLASRVVAEHRGVLERGGCRIELIAEGPVVGWWDPDRLAQVLGSLLSNAVKFGPGRPVTVRVSEAQGRAVLSVRDRGVGIAPERHERIFEQFEEAVSPAHFAGLGVSLYLARQLVRAHGGTIRVESDVGQGAEFIVELPAGEAPAA